MNFSSSTSTYSTQVLFPSIGVCTSNKAEALQRRRSPPFSSAHQVTSVERILIQYPLAAVSTEPTKRLAPILPSRHKIFHPVPELQPTAVDQVCSSRNKQGTTNSSTKLQHSAVAKFAAPATQELPSTSTASTATTVDQVCSSWDNQELL